MIDSIRVFIWFQYKMLYTNASVLVHGSCDGRLVRYAAADDSRPCDYNLSISYHHRAPEVGYYRTAAFLGLGQTLFKRGGGSQKTSKPDGRA